VLFLRTTGLGAALGRLENAGVAVTQAWAASRVHAPIFVSRPHGDCRPND
jgi:hypothetical protein